MSVAASSLDNFEKRPAKLQFCARASSCWQREGIRFFSLNAISSLEWVARAQDQASAVVMLLIINVSEDKSFFFCRV